MSKRDLVQLLHSIGDNRTALKVEAELPDEIDTERDASALSDAGLPHDRLRATLAAGALPRIVG